MLPDRVSNPGPLTCESGALPIALRGPAENNAYIAASSAYKGGENANKNSYSAISWHEICSAMSSDVSYVM